MLRECGRPTWTRLQNRAEAWVATHSNCLELEQSPGTLILHRASLSRQLEQQFLDKLP